MSLVAAMRALRVNRLPAGPIDAIAVIGPSGSGKSTLVDAVRSAQLPGVVVPRRFVTRPRRASDDGIESVHLDPADFDARAAEMVFSWERPMEAGRIERYGFARPGPGVAVYAGNDAMLDAPVPGEVLWLAVFAPDVVRAQRLARRSPDLPLAELTHRLGDDGAAARARAHIVADNHGELESLAPIELVRLVARIAEGR